MNPATWTLKQQTRARPRGGGGGSSSHPGAARRRQLLLDAPGSCFRRSSSGSRPLSLIFLSATVGMVSARADGARRDKPVLIIGNLATQGRGWRHVQGAPPRMGPDRCAQSSRSCCTTLIGLIGGAVASRSAGIYFLMITLTYSVIATLRSAGDEDLGILGDRRDQRYTPGWIGNVVGHPNRLYYIALGVAIAVYVLIRYILRTPFGVTLQGVRDEPIRMSSLGYNVALHRTLAFGFAPFSPPSPGSCTSGGPARSRRGTPTCRRRSTCSSWR